MNFAQMWGDELTIQLGSADGSGASGATNKRFTTVRRKREVNAGMREFVRLTSCVVTRGSVTGLDETRSYDLEATLTDFWFLSEQEGVSIKIVNDDTDIPDRYLVEGRDLTRVDARRLDRESASWRSAEPGTPRRFGIRREGGQLLIEFDVPFDIPDDETWTIQVPYVPRVADMSADDDEPFTISGNVAKHLEPWHLAPVHWAAHKLEKLRKNYAAAKEQLDYFAGLVADYHDKQEIPGGDVVTFAHDYYAGTRRAGGVFAGDPEVEW